MRSGIVRCYRPLLVVFVSIAVLVGSACSQGPGQRWDAASSAPTGDVRAVEVTELDAAVRDAVAQLVDATTIEAGWVTRHRGDVVHSGWLRYVGEDTYALVRHEDRDAAVEMSRFGRPASPEEPRVSNPSGGGEVVVVMDVVADGRRYAAVVDGSGRSEWQMSEEIPPSPYPWSIDLDRMASGGYVQAVEASETTVQEAADGGQIWTLREAGRPEDVVQRWHVAPDGILRGYEMDHPGAGSDPTPRTLEYRFLPGETAPEVQAPEPAPAELDHLDTWDDLPAPA